MDKLQQAHEKELLDSRRASPKIHRTIKIPISQSDVVSELITFTNLCDGKEHFCLGFDFRETDIPLVRIHSECITGDVFGSKRCDCGPQLQHAIKRISEERGLILYMRQEGRGIGLLKKMEAYALQEAGIDTYRANTLVGSAEDARDYTAAFEMLKLLNLSRVRLLSNNPKKRTALEDAGIQVVESVSTGTFINLHNESYLKAKRDHGGHKLSIGTNNA